MAPNHGFLLTDASGEPVSRTYQYRKVMKPMLERKRRARINRCLDELKELMTGALQTEGENVAKLEKADILELTVRHLHNLRRQNPTIRPDQSYADRFKAGFRHCAAEVTHFLSGVDQHTSVHVLKHLNLCIKQLDTMPQHQLLQSPIKHTSSPSPPSIAAQPQMPVPTVQLQSTHYQSGIWTQKPIQPPISAEKFNAISHRGFRSNTRSVEIPMNKSDLIDIDDEYDCDIDDDGNSITQIHTPPLSPNIEVVDDPLIWRPW